MSALKNEVPHFKSVSRIDVPTGRNGKHKSIVTEILSDLKNLKDGSALKIPLKDLPDTKENIRSALNRAGKKAEVEIGTSADDLFLYLWNKK